MHIFKQKSGEEKEITLIELNHSCNYNYGSLSITFAEKGSSGIPLTRISKYNYDGHTIPADPADAYAEMFPPEGATSISYPIPIQKNFVQEIVLPITKLTVTGVSKLILYL